MSSTFVRDIARFTRVVLLYNLPRRVRRSLGILLLLSACILQADSIDDYAERHLNQNSLPGMSLAIVKDGVVVKAKGYGFANMELKVPASPETVYQLASVTKQFTATAVMLLVEDGKLRLSDPILRHLTNLPAAWSNITVRHLLNMTSGIKDHFRHISPERGREEFTPEGLVALVANDPLQFPAGERMAYSNMNYLLLAMLIHRISGETYDAFLMRRVFEPLQMNATRRDNPSHIIPHRASLYERGSNGVENVRYLSPSLWNNGDGGLLSTVLDLAKWDAALYTNTVLKRASLDEMWSTRTLASGEQSKYGFGWQLGQLRGHRYVSHGGARPGTAAQIMRFVDDRLTVIVLMNGPGQPDRVATYAAGQYISGLTISSMPVPKDPNPEQTSALKQAIIELAQTKDSARITPEFRKSFSTSRRRFEALRRDTENMKSFSYITTETSKRREQGTNQGKTVCYYRIETESQPAFYAIELTEDGSISSIDFAE